MTRARVLSQGVKSPLGTTVDTVWEAALEATAAAEKRECTYIDQTRDFVVRPTEFDGAEYFERAELRRMDRLHVLGLAAAADAIAAVPGGIDPDRTAVVAGIGFCALGKLEEQHALTLTNPRRVNPLAIPLTMVNSLAAHAAMRFGITGPSHTVSTACASGTDAVGYSLFLLRAGLADRVLVIGADAMLVPGAMQFFARTGATCKAADDLAVASRPFDIDRSGLVLGEAAGALVLESDALAPSSTADGDTALGYIAGYGASSDAHHVTAPHPEGVGAVAAMTRAVADAGLVADDITSVNAHGTSTKLNDATEARAIGKVFGSAMPVTSIKGASGHCIAGSGLLEAIVALRTARTGIVPPIGGLRTLDPACEINAVAGQPLRGPAGPVISNSFGFGGHNASIVVTP